MKIKKIIRFYFREQRSRIFQQLLPALNHFDEKAIHQLRVCIKQLRALYKLMEVLTPDAFSARQQFKEMKRLFRPAGQLRDIQVQVNLLKDYARTLGHPCNEFKTFILKNEASHQREFCDALLTFDVDSLEKNYKKIRQVLEEIREKEIYLKSELWLEKQFKLAFKLAEMLASEEKIHQLRKLVKAAYFTFLLIYEDQVKLKKGEKPFGSLKELEEMIGLWHDRCVLLGLMSKFLKQANGDAANPVYRQLKETVEFENEKFLIDLPSLIHRELNVDKILQRDLAQIK